MKLTRKAFLSRLGVAAGAAVAAAGRVPSVLARTADPRAGVGPSKVASVEVFPMSVRVREVQKIAIPVPITADNVLVRLTTDDGVIGYGESSPYAPVMGETQASELAMAKAIAPMVKGRDPFTLPKIVDAIRAFSPASPGITAAFEMALWDICGKVAGQPVYRLLGAARESFETDRTVFFGTPAEVAAKARDLAGQGFRNIKIKLGQAPADDIATVRAIREAVGPDVALRADANQGWSVADAILALRGIEPFRVQFCEQPVHSWDWAGLEQVRGSVPVPVMADESVHTPHDAITGVRAGAFDMINLKLMKTGGILQAVRLAHVAAAANVPCMLGCMNETRIALTAAAHVVMSQEIIRYADLDAFFEQEIDPVVGGMQVNKGVVTLPDGPGLGLDVDPAFLKTLRPVTL